MIIDTHAHIGKILDFDMTEEQLLYSMEKYGIDFSLISHIEAAESDHQGKPIPKEYQRPQKELLKEILEIAKRNKNKLGVLIWMKIGSELPDAEFEKIFCENRQYIYGLKFHPFHSRTSPDDDRLESIYEFAKKYKLPVVSHTGGCEEASSHRLYRAAQKHKDINFVMVHMDLGTDNSQAIDYLGKLPNLYGDTTWVPIKSTLKAVSLYGSQKILFGTDNPIDGKDTLLYNKTGDRSLYQEYFNEFKKSVSKTDYENIMYKNAQRLFSISCI